MEPFAITVYGANMEDLRAKLLGLVEEIDGAGGDASKVSRAVGGTATVVEPKAADKAKRTRKPKEPDPVPEDDDDFGDDAGAEEGAADDDDFGEDDGGEEAWTRDDVKKFLGEIRNHPKLKAKDPQGGLKEIRKITAAYNVSKISELPEAKFGEIIEKCRATLARLDK